MIDRRAGAVQHPRNRLLGARRVFKLVVRARRRLRKLLVDRAKAVIRLEITGVDLTQRLESLLGARVCADFELGLADNAESAARPFESDCLLGNQPQVSATPQIA